MVHIFKLNKEALKRKFAVYVVIAKGSKETKLYVGKTGDNREGCNPIISRCGNHFSYNKIHSQVRNKIEDHENREYTYVFEHFDPYFENVKRRRKAIDRINEMERWLNQEVQKLIIDSNKTELLNPISGNGYLHKTEKDKRNGFRTDRTRNQIRGIIMVVQRNL